MRMSSAISEDAKGKRFLLVFGLLGILCILGFLSLKGCARGSNGKPTPPPSSTGPAIQEDELKPSALVSAKATLTYANLDIPVEMKVKKGVSEIEVELIAHEEVMETEIYTFDMESFKLKEAAAESYNPPLPLLTFPLNLGETKTWSGTILSGDSPHKGDATISAKEDAVDMPDGTQQPAIKVTVELRYDSGTPVPAKRTLEFWFAKGQGPIKRDFGEGASRAPR